MSLTHWIAYRLLGTNRTEIREQFRRVESETGTSTELVQTQALLGISHARKPEPYNVDDREENYLQRHVPHRTVDFHEALSLDREAERKHQ